MSRNSEKPDQHSESQYEKREGYVARLTALLHDWSDEIPSEMVSSLDKKKYKVRNAWFTLVSCHAEQALEFLNEETFTGEIMGQLDPVIDTAREHAQPSEGDDRRNTREQIDVCNAVLQKVIDRLTQENKC